MNNRSLIAAVATVLLMLTNSAHAAGMRPVRDSGAGGCTFINTDVTFDGGANFASISTCTGNDVFGFAQNQTIAAFYDSGTTCTAPDQTPGELYILEFASSASTYQIFNDQISSYSVDGSLCGSNTSGVQGGSATYVVNGGTGRFKGATGPINNSFNTTFLYFHSTPEQTGYFGRSTFTSTGTVTP